MSAKAKLTTIVSTKGQVIVPAAVRRRKRWDVGARLEIEETTDGVLLKSERPFKPTKPDEVFGCLKRPGRAISLEEMDAAVLHEAARRESRR